MFQDILVRNAAEVNDKKATDEDRVKKKPQ